MDTNSLCKSCDAYIWPTNGARVIPGARLICSSNRLRYVDGDRPVAIRGQAEVQCAVNSKSI